MSIQIQTTQNVILNLREAGLGPRIAAFLLDLLFLFLWIVGSLLLLDSFMPSDLIALVFLITFILYAFYHLLFEFFNNGQSLGKKIMSIRVVNLDGTTPSFGSYLIRWLFRIVDFSLTGGVVAVLMIAFTEKSQRLGDYLAGTTVISLKSETNSHQINYFDLDFHEDYKVTYPELLEKLNDKDISTIRSILGDYRYYNDFSTMRSLADKVKNATGYTYDGNDRAFLKKILDDYTYLSMQ